MEQNKEGFWRKSCLFIDRVNLLSGNIFCYTSVVMMCLMSYEVICRYLFNSPSDWSGEINEYLLLMMSMMGGGYALLIDQHVRVDIIYRYFSPKQRSAVELATWWLAFLFFLALLWFGGEIAIEAFIKNKRSASLMEMPLYPSLFFIPIGAFLLLFQALARMIRCVLTLATGVDELGHGKGIA
jgi:TRAP-type mannitol/chloroaromatic compound transport system permease small subunit